MRYRHCVPYNLALSGDRPGERKMSISRASYRSYIHTALRVAARGFALLTFRFTATAQSGDAPSQRILRPQDLKALAWRSIGPANMAGRVATIALAPGNSKTYFVRFATGGLWKTTNNGTMFTPVFDDRPEFLPAGEYTVSITYGDHKGQTTITVLPVPGSELK